MVCLRDVPVSHKHGWDGITYGDAGIVMSPGGDYVIVIYVSDPSTGWLLADISFPILREMSQLTYNYFNFDNPYLEDPQVRADRAAAALAAQEAATAAAETVDDEGDSLTTPTPNNSINAP